MEETLNGIARAMVGTEKALLAFLEQVPLDDRALVEARITEALGNQDRLLAWCVGYSEPKPFDPEMGEECCGPLPDGGAH